MIITEPATMLTDYALAALSAAFAFRLHRYWWDRRVSLWVAAFSVTAFAAVAGGTAHGFRAALGDRWDVMWSTTLVLIGAAVALLVVAGARSAMHPQAVSDRTRRDGVRWLKRAIAVSIAGLAVLTLKLAPHTYFNHNDVYHVIQMGGLFCLFRGVGCLHWLTAAR